MSFMSSSSVQRSPENRKRELSLFKEMPAFRRLLTGWTISALGDSLNQAAVIFLVLSATGGEGLQTGLAVGLRLSSRLIFAGLGGVLADRFERRNVLVLLDLCLGITALLFIFAGITRSLPGLYILTILMGALSAAHAATRPVYLRDVTGADRFDQALALIQVGFGLMLFLGYGLGGALLSIAGCAIVFTLDALSFFFSALCTWTTRPAQPQKRSVDSMTKRGVFREWLLGWQYLKTKPVLLYMVLTNAIWSLGGGSVFVLISLLNYRDFNNNPVTLGLFFAMTGVGALAAAWIRPQLGQGFTPEAHIIGWACVIEGILFLLLPHIQFLPLTLAVLAAQFSAAFLFGLAYQPLLLRITESALRGRISGLDSGVYLSLYGLSAAVHGSIAEVLGLEKTACLAGGIMTIAGLFWFRFLRSPKRVIRSGTATHPDIIKL
ncbi:MAG: MFS transporter [Candidatus Electrothrix sp. AW1]|nr:MFS transporter [Candidatus Electrothrix sp. AX1]MCI5182928.1 MFS transporter [Candidatus Electrothrix gigas]